eukprot:613559-Amphidinium_carterae.1
MFNVWNCNCNDSCRNCMPRPRVQTHRGEHASPSLAGASSLYGGSVTEAQLHLNAAVEADAALLSKEQWV